MHCTRDRIGGDRFFRIYCHHARMDTRIAFFTLNTRCTPLPALSRRWRCSASTPAPTSYQAHSPRGYRTSTALPLLLLLCFASAYSCIRIRFCLCPQAT